MCVLNKNRFYSTFLVKFQHIFGLDELRTFCNLGCEELARLPIDVSS